jgi:hypothetical protein
LLPAQTARANGITVTVTYSVSNALNITTTTTISAAFSHNISATTVTSHSFAVRGLQVANREQRRPRPDPLCLAIHR